MDVFPAFCPPPHAPTTPHAPSLTEDVTLGRFCGEQEGPHPISKRRLLFGEAHVLPLELVEPSSPAVAGGRSVGQQRLDVPSQERALIRPL